MPKIHVDQLAYTVMQELDRYHEHIVEDLGYVIEAVAKDTVAELHETAPIGHTGAYAQSWAQKLTVNRHSASISRVVYSKKPQYGKAHLLENGHESTDGGFVRPRPHIAVAEAHATDQLVKQLTKRIGDKE